MSNNIVPLLLSPHSYLVQPPTCTHPRMVHLRLKGFGRKPCFLTKLGTQMCGAGIAQPKSYFANRELAIAQEFFGKFHPLQYSKPFNGHAPNLAEQLAQRTIVLCQPVLKKERQSLSFALHSHPFDYCRAYLFHKLCLRVGKQFKSYRLQLTAYIGQIILRQILLHPSQAQPHKNDSEPLPTQQVLNCHHTARAYHVFDMQLGHFVFSEKPIDSIALRKSSSEAEPST